MFIYVLPNMNIFGLDTLLQIYQLDVQIVNYKQDLNYLYFYLSTRLQLGMIHITVLALRSVSFQN
jgi:hypothetical protein